MISVLLKLRIVPQSCGGWTCLPRLLSQGKLWLAANAGTRVQARTAPSWFRASVVACCLVAIFAPSVIGGGSGYNVLVVVNQASTNSVRLGNAYAAVRGVPPANVFRMTNWSGGRITWTRRQFETHLRNPMLEHIDAYGLSNQIQYVLLSMDIPFRVKEGENENSTTSALFYGFKTNTVAPQPGLPITCSRPESAKSSYGFSELPWPEGKPSQADGPSFLAMMLTGRSYELAEATLRSSAAADYTRPAQTVYLAKTTDAARNVRYIDFDNALFEARLLGDHTLMATNTDFTGFTGARGLSTGLFGFSIPPNAYVPGGLADSLTSWSGAIFENQVGTILSFLEGGAAATYGTVVEPCNVPAKFPNPLLYFYQSRGFTAVESYYLSLGMPFEGLLLGEPLSAPFARVGTPGKLAYTNGMEMPDRAVLSNAIPLTFTFYGPDLQTPLDTVDLFIDGLLQTNILRVAPTAGNSLRVLIDDTAIRYDVPPGATLSGVAEGLAAAINTRTNVTGVEALAIGDRVLLRANDPGLSGLAPSLSASVSQGTAARTTTFLRAAQPAFLSSPAYGYFGMAVSNSPAVGDWLALEFIKTNGQKVVVGVTNNVAGVFMSDFARQLVNAVNATSSLRGADGVRADDLYPYAQDRAAYFAVYARSPGWDAAQIQIDLQGSPGLVLLAEGERLLDNKADLVPRNHLYLGAGAVLLGAPILLDTTRLPDGWHELAGVAYEGTSVRTQTRVARRVQIKNTTLEARIRLLPSSTISPGATAEVEVAANSSDVRAIELFSTGGLLGTATNSPNARFTLAASHLGLGTHPIYAIVTRNDGARYRTERVTVEVSTAPRLEISGVPRVLSWNGTSGRTYQVETSSDLVNFTLSGEVTATNSTVQWQTPPGSANAQFYRLKVLP